MESTSMISTRNSRATASRSASRRCRTMYGSRTSRCRESSKRPRVRPPLPKSGAPRGHLCSGISRRRLRVCGCGAKDQQVELLLSARRIIQKIMPAPARPASGSVKDTCIDADTLMLQVRLRLSACMREHDLSLKHNSILGSQLRKHALFRPLGSPYPTPVSWPADAPPTALPSTGTNAADTEASRVAPREDAAGQEGGTQQPASKRAKKREPAPPSPLAASASTPETRHSEDGDGVEGKRRQPARARRNRARKVMGRVEVSVREKPQKGPEMISLFLITH